MSARFTDRVAAGRELGERLRARVAGRSTAELLVLGLARGGVPVAVHVAAALGASWDVLVVRKLGVPRRPELAMGAVAAGVTVLDEAVVRSERLGDEEIAAAATAARAEVDRREALFRSGCPALDVSGRGLVLVDDGLATGATMRAGVHAVRLGSPHSIAVAVPVSSHQALAMLQPLVDDLVAVFVPTVLRAVGGHYDDFSQLADEDVLRLLTEENCRRRAGGRA